MGCRLCNMCLGAVFGKVTKYWSALDWFRLFLLPKPTMLCVFHVLGSNVVGPLKKEYKRLFLRP